jgi:hypothetical protein
VVRRALVLSVAFFGVAALAARPAAAQTISGFALDRFEPAAAGGAFLSQESLEFEGHLRATASLVGDWASKPLVFYQTSGTELAPLVRQQGLLHADAAVTLWDRARVDVGLPLALVDGGTDVQIRATQYGAPSGSVVGDLRLGATARIFGGARDALRGAAGAQLFFPTGGTRAFTSDGGVRFWPQLMLAGTHARFVWGARAGLHLRPSCTCDLAPGSEVTFGGAGGWWATPRLLLGAELYGSQALAQNGAFGGASPPLELLFQSQLVVKDHWRVSAGVAPGLTNGPGAPVVRAVIGVAFDLELVPPPRPTAAPISAPH